MNYTRHDLIDKLFYNAVLFQFRDFSYTVSSVPREQQQQQLPAQWVSNTCHPLSGSSLIIKSDKIIVNHPVRVKGAAKSEQVCTTYYLKCNPYYLDFE